MVPVPRVANLAELNEHLIKVCLNYRNTHKLDSRSCTVKEAYEGELYYLKQIPVYRYDTSRIATPTVGDYSTLRFDKNDYSVPVRYLRKQMTVKGYANEVCIFHEGELVATFYLLYGSGKIEYRMEHYLTFWKESHVLYFRQSLSDAM